MSLDPRLLPKYVRKELAALTVEAAMVPDVVESEPGVWHITADNGRVRVVSVYSRAQACNGAAHNWVSATLAIDGAEPVPIHRLDDVGDAFHAPDDVVAGRPVRPAAVASWTAPTPVRAAYKALHAALCPPDTLVWGSPVAVGRIGRRWVLAADAAHASLRIHWYLHNGSWAHAQERPAELVVHGVDRSAELAGDLDRVPAFLTSAALPCTAGGTPAGPAATATSVQVRGTVVRRE